MHQAEGAAFGEQRADRASRVRGSADPADAAGTERKLSGQAAGPVRKLPNAAQKRPGRGGPSLRRTSSGDQGEHQQREHLYKWLIAQ